VKNCHQTSELWSKDKESYIIIMLDPYKIYIYKIWYDDDPNIFYVGSTQDIESRISCHKTCGNSLGKSKIYRLIKEKGNNFNYNILDSCMVLCRDEQLKYEQKWIDELKPTLNSSRARTLCRIKQYYREQNIERIKRQEIEETYFCCGRIQYKMHHFSHLDSMGHQVLMNSIRKFKK
jgi:hypothetical protein